ncbi:MAG: hypothetical protein DBX59_02380 [Bacillota bacterium]|nr:MAG: hypothetical protein DBX59_02380 [Bacillota bacterium]
MKKFLSLLVMCIVLCACAFTGCSPAALPNDPNAGKEVDLSKAQLYVSNFNGGMGYEWLSKIIKRFEADYAETEFLEGTKGVQVWIDNHKGLDDDKIPTVRDEVLFLENCNYYDMIYNGYLLEITDMVTEPLTAYGETKSVEDKLSESYRDFYKTEDDKYYGIPHHSTVYSITYDIDLFDRNKLFFDAGGNISKKSTDSGLSAGPDGENGTYDDGLPATYKDFYKLCSTMKKRGVAPVAWSGMYPFYVTLFAEALKVDFEGDEAHLQYDFNGTATKIVDRIENDGTVVYKNAFTISEENGYETFGSAGNYYAFDFIYNLIKNDYYYSKSFNEAISHTDIQSIFLQSSFTSEQDIGMLVEGNWWVNEASPTFKSMAAKYKGSSLNERRLALMPMPKATEEQIGEPQTMVDQARSLSCINANIDKTKIQLAKTFLQYCETQESLLETFLTTNILRGFEVDTSAVYDTLSTYGKSVVDTTGVKANKVIPLSSCDVFYRNYSAFLSTQLLATKEYTAPSSAFKDGVTSAELFNKLQNKYNEETWALLLSK